MPDWSLCELLGPFQSCDPPNLTGVLSIDSPALWISSLTWQPWRHHSLVCWGISSSHFSPRLNPQHHIKQVWCTCLPSRHLGKQSSSRPQRYCPVPCWWRGQAQSVFGTNFLSALSFSAPSQVEGSWSDVAVGCLAPLLCLLW